MLEGGTGRKGSLVPCCAPAALRAVDSWGLCWGHECFLAMPITQAHRGGLSSDHQSVSGWDTAPTHAESLCPWRAARSPRSSAATNPALLCSGFEEPAGNPFPDPV